MTATATKKTGKRKLTKEEKAAIREGKRTALAEKEVAECKTLIPQIQTTYQEVVSSMETGLKAAIRLGGMLDTIKRTLKHGNYQQWIEDNCPFSYRSAANYRTLFKKQGELPQREDISYKRAIAMLRRDPKKAVTVTTKNTKTTKTGGIKISTEKLSTLIERYGFRDRMDSVHKLLKAVGVKVV